MGGVVDFVTGKSGKEAAAASREAAGIAAAGQTEALEYLKEREQLPRGISERALGQLAGLFGVQLPSEYYQAGLEGDALEARITEELGERPTGGGMARGLAGKMWDQKAEALREELSAGGPLAGTTPMSQADFLSGLKDTPLYQAILGTRKAGEEGILRSAAATGGLRSGGVQANLADYNQRLEERALLSSYEDQLRGLTGLAGLPSMAPQIAQATAAPAMTQAQGITAGAQAQQANTAGLMQGLFNLGGSALIGFCDSRLKKNVRPAGERLGYPWYTWDWNEKAEELGLSGPGEGVMAHEIAEINPEAVGVGKTGYLIVNYGAL